MELIIQISIGVALGIIFAWLFIKKNLMKNIFNSAYDIIALVVLIIIFWGVYSWYDLNPKSFFQWLFLAVVIGVGLAIEIFFPTKKNWLISLRVFSLIIGVIFLMILATHIFNS